MIKSAVIGLGNIAGKHIDAINTNPLSTLVGVCDIDTSLKNVVENAPFFTDYIEMVKETKPNCVHICLPHNLHYTVAANVAQLKCNIFTEKPIALCVSEELKLVNLEEKFGVKICVCMQNRLNSTVVELKNMLNTGDYGRIIGIQGTLFWNRQKEYYLEKPWRSKQETAGGGCMITQAIHTLDLMQYIANEKIHSVKGMIGQILDYGFEIEDSAMARIEFQNGIEGLFTATVANYEDQSVSIEVKCEKIKFAIKDSKLWKLDGTTAKLLAEDKKPTAGKQVYGNSHIALIDSFYKSLTDNTSHMHPSEALPSIWLVDAIKESSKTGKVVMYYTNSKQM